jgi:hypothetical protein
MCDVLSLTLYRLRRVLLGKRFSCVRASVLVVSQSRPHCLRLRPCGLVDNPLCFRDPVAQTVHMYYTMACYALLYYSVLYYTILYLSFEAAFFEASQISQRFLAISLPDHGYHKRPLRCCMIFCRPPADITATLCDITALPRLSQEPLGISLPYHCPPAGITRTP